MKIVLISMAALLAGCCSDGNLRTEIHKNAASCNDVCKANPEISAYMHKEDGGIPLLLSGGMEVNCTCNRK